MSDGWVVVNVGEATWLRHEAFGGRCSSIVYPRAQLALDHGAGVEERTSSPRDAYARFGHWRLGRPESWQRLPWA